jgi:hypothetical protein
LQQHLKKPSQHSLSGACKCMYVYISCSMCMYLHVSACMSTSPSHSGRRGGNGSGHSGRWGGHGSAAACKRGHARGNGHITKHTLQENCSVRRVPKTKANAERVYPNYKAHACTSNCTPTFLLSFETALTGFSKLETSTKMLSEPSTSLYCLIDSDTGNSLVPLPNGMLRQLGSKMVMVSMCP